MKTTNLKRLLIFLLIGLLATACAPTSEPIPTAAPSTDVAATPTPNTTDPTAVPNTNTLLTTVQNALPANAFDGLAVLPLNAPQSEAVSPPLLSTLFWSVLGLAALGLGLFLPQFNRLMGTPNPEDQFTVPKFKRTAQLNGRVARAILIFLGLGMMLNGIGYLILPPVLVTIAAYTLLALASLGILLMVVITASNWRA